MQGWIKLHRSIKENWVWQSPIYLKMWIDFLIRANHQDNKFLMESELIDIQRGSFITSLKKLAKEYRSSIGKIRHFLKLLENDLMIELKTTHKYTRITLCNYEAYQNGEHTESFQNETDKNDKNEKNVKNEKNNTDYFLDLLQNESESFITTWKEWIEFRKEIKKKLTQSTAKKQIEFLNKQPNKVDCINQSIKNGWQGLFEINNGASNGNKGRKQYENQQGTSEGFQVIQ